MPQIRIAPRIALTGYSRKHPIHALNPESPPISAAAQGASMTSRQRVALTRRRPGSILQLSQERAQNAPSLTW
jgi:hypothetical protein